MQEAGSWHSLCSSHAGIPSLLLKAAFTENGYDIQLTDLSRLWRQSLSKSQIVTQARAYRCSIDPSEDDEQYHILQDKLWSALRQDTGTSLSLSSAHDGGLELQLSAPLPAPLPDLEWTVILSRAPAEDVSQSLIQPLLLQANNLQTQMKQLMAELQAKDKVIAKITDRLETSGHDLTAVFPGVSNVRVSKKKTQQEQLARHVVGLGRFDEDAWREKVGRNGTAGGDGLTRELLDGVLGSLPVTKGGDEGKADWWRKLKGGKIELGGDVAMGGMETVKAEVSARDSRGVSKTPRREDDDFQRQATPPGLRHNHGTSAPSGPAAANGHDTSEGEENGEDDDDLDAPSQPTRRSQRSQQSQPREGQRSTEPTVSKEPPPPARPVQKQPFLEDDDDETEDEDDLDAAPKSTSRQAPSKQPSPPLQQPSPSPATTASPAPRKKLGAIGGKKQQSSPSPAASATASEAKSSQPPASPPRPKARVKLGTIGGKANRPKSPEPPSATHGDASAPPSPAKAKTKKLGVLGGEKASTTSQQVPAAVDEPPSSPGPRTSEADERTSRPSKREPEPEPMVRETSEERADKKREVLKKELEEKAKQPAKKKRKF